MFRKYQFLCVCSQAQGQADDVLILLWPIGRVCAESDLQDRDISGALACNVCGVCLIPLLCFRMGLSTLIDTPHVCMTWFERESAVGITGMFSSGFLHTSNRCHQQSYVHAEIHCNFDCIIQTNMGQWLHALCVTCMYCVSGPMFAKVACLAA